MRVQTPPLVVFGDETEPAPLGGRGAAGRHEAAWYRSLESRS